MKKNEYWKREDDGRGWVSYSNGCSVEKRVDDRGVHEQVGKGDTTLTGKGVRLLPTLWCTLFTRSTKTTWKLVTNLSLETYFSADSFFTHFLSLSLLFRHMFIVKAKEIYMY